MCLKEEFEREKFAVWMEEDLPNTGRCVGSGVSEKRQRMGNRWWHEELAGDVYHWC